ncbi:hypothetical protein [Paenibacillus methanolicus]|uniref:Uncharacterized protein n=1 Tax=Paenibacillus methanolicus TaxID=582686 RepID=A0A5S5BXE5_9BACL|nr:hypothetical protein [Paenibacillus methanolicus]TYP71845.1 hypothetical protein BCM02_109123 [Paenibacillus methanolicus]
MLVVGSFQIATELEQVLALLENTGIGRDRIMAVPMDIDETNDALEPIQSRDRKAGGFETGMACATALSVIGTSRGFIWPWGPIICGIISAIIGFGLGLLLHAIISQARGGRPRKPARLPEVTVLIRCQPDSVEAVRRLLWQHQAISVGVVRRQDT